MTVNGRVMKSMLLYWFPVIQLCKMDWMMWAIFQFTKKAIVDSQPSLQNGILVFGYFSIIF